MRDRFEGASGVDGIPSSAETRDEFQAWIEALFGDLPDGVVVSRCGRVLYANAPMSDLLGASEDDLVGRALLELYPEAERVAVLAHIQSMAFSGRPQAPALSTLRRRDGATRRLEVARLLLPLEDEPLLVEVVRDASGPRGASTA